MRIFVDLNLIESVYTRESARIVLLAECMKRLGHDVSYGPRKAVERCINFSPFGARFMPTITHTSDHKFSKHDVVMYSSEQHEKHQGKSCKKVCIKTRYGNHNDLAIAAASDVYVAIEPGMLNDRNVEHYAAIDPDIKKKHLSVPHMVHPKVWAWIDKYNLWEAYLRNDLRVIRDAVLPAADADDDLLFVGNARNGRREMCAKLPKWCKCILRDEPLSISRYLQTLCHANLSLCLPGCRPKTYRFIESVMLGVCTVVTTYPHIEHPVDDVTVRLTDWDSDTLSVMRELPKTCAAIAAEASVAYARHWSPAGQASSILRRLNYEDSTR